MAGQKNTRLNISAGLASVAVAATLVALKLWALGLTSSLSVAASLADNALDLMMSLGGLLAILYAARPADEDHAFGHTSVEDLAALAQSVFIAVSGTVIAWAATARLLGLMESRIAAQGQGIAVMGLSVLLTLMLVLWQRRVARRTGSRVVAADSLHYLSDLLPTLGAIGALWASQRFGLAHVDSVVALASAAILLVGSMRIGKGAWDALMDRTADPDLVEAIAAIARDWPGVRGFHDLKTRMAGSRVFVHIHIELDGDQSLRDAHAIGAGLRRKIILTYPQCEVIVHKDVAGES
ncbi:cation diffusion facilitator family transporter [Defluviimonas sp. WL0002]|uniref:Cation diffusion facilitator family transporter n=1 Tax=Albidovulum marisflavi TaxID=2984159 RepID=A0ABT2ZA75_9RHOB|nr:cation diffusion facilitator family transporter [Defluviimonas sp. WL0002]MCV2867978.1 cation diffusion facilitator family transporter [Defluviimonas sp. WL0002]